MNPPLNSDLKSRISFRHFLEKPRPIQVSKSGKMARNKDQEISEATFLDFNFPKSQRTFLMISAQALKIKQNKDTFIILIRGHLIGIIKFLYFYFFFILPISEAGAEIMKKIKEKLLQRIPGL